MGSSLTTAPPSRASTHLVRSRPVGHPDLTQATRLSLLQLIVFSLSLFCGPSQFLAVLEPLGFGAFCQAIARTKNPSPAPDGLPFGLWTALGDAGRKVLDDAYCDILSGVAPPPEFNRSLVVCIPKELDLTVPGVPSALASRVWTIALSNNSHKLIVQVVNITLEQLADAVVHSSQRGFTPGRGMMRNIVDALSPLRLARYLADDVSVVVLFDMHATFPKRLMGLHLAGAALGVADCAIAGPLLGSYSDLLFGGAVSQHGSLVRLEVLQGCHSSGSLWATLFDPVVRALCTAHPEPLGLLTALLDDLAAAFLNVLSCFGPRMDVFTVLPLATCRGEARGGARGWMSCRGEAQGEARGPEGGPLGNLLRSWRSGLEFRTKAGATGTTCREKKSS